MAFETNSVTMTGMVRAMKSEGVFDQILEMVQPASREVLLNPVLSKWYDSTISIDVNAAMLRLGAEKLQQVNYRMTKDSVGRLMLPVIKVALAISGGSPASIFARLDGMVKITNRGLNVEWRELTPRSGVATTVYESDFPAELIDGVWRGIFRFGSELVKYTIRIDRFEPLDARRFAFHVSW